MNTQRRADRAAALKVASDAKKSGPAPEHTRFADIAHDYTARAGAFPNSDGGQLARQAVSAIREASASIADYVGAAGRVAADRNLYKDGRIDTVRGLRSAAADESGEHLNRAQSLVHVARAEFELTALRKVSRSEEATARADAQMLLASTSPADLPVRMAELAKRDDPVGALIASHWGRDYLASRGAKVDGHQLARQSALDAAKVGADPARAAAATAHASLQHLDGAILAVHQQARTAGDDMAGIAHRIA